MATLHRWIRGLLVDVAVAEAVGWAGFACWANRQFAMGMAPDAYRSLTLKFALTGAVVGLLLSLGSTSRRAR